MKNRKILRQVFYAIEVVLDSPLCVSGGTSDIADMDVMRDGDGRLFVPGSSLAGAFRAALHQSKNQSGLMGFSEGQIGNMSSLYVSDMIFRSHVKTSIRDGIELKSRGYVNNKFDSEIIETGATGQIFLHYVEREGDPDFRAIVDSVIGKMAKGEIRFGMKKNRGFGKMKVRNVYCREFSSQDDLNEFLQFKNGFKEICNYESYSYNGWKNDCESDYEILEIPLKLTGGISIRKYSAEPEKADYEHLTCNGKPVIPGSSWAGAIRSDIKRILTETGYSNPDDAINTWFGYVNINKTSQQSMVIFEESVIEGATKLQMTRNKINRFDGSAVGQALYTDISYFGGTTTLRILIRKDIKEAKHEPLMKVLEAAIWDLTEGYLPIGGLVSVGRGIFTRNDVKVGD